MWPPRALAQRGVIVAYLNFFSETTLISFNQEQHHKDVAHHVDITKTFPLQLQCTTCIICPQVASLTVYHFVSRKHALIDTLWWSWKVPPCFLKIWYQ